MAYTGETYTDFGAALTAMSARLAVDSADLHAKVDAIPAARPIVTVRFVCPAIAANTNVNVDVPWPAPFPDLNYTLLGVTLEDTAANATDASLVRHVLNRAVDKLTVRVGGGASGFAAGIAVLHLAAVHD